MNKPAQADLLYLSSTFSKLLKRRFGKGPETCYVISKGTRLYIYMRNFITPAEEVLIKAKELDLATSFRSKVIQAVTEQFIPEATAILGTIYHNFLHDWNYDTNTGILLLEGKSLDEEIVDVPLERPLFDLIESVSSRYHKVPDRLEIVKFTQNICAIEAKGVLTQLESLVYSRGEVQLLFQQSRYIKKAYIKQKGGFEDLFNRNIVDMFILWDYDSNRHYLIFNFNKVNPYLE